MSLFAKRDSGEATPKKESRKELEARLAAEEAERKAQAKAAEREELRTKLLTLSEKELLIEILLLLNDSDNGLAAISKKLSDVDHEASSASTMATIANLNAVSAALRK